MNMETLELPSGTIFDASDIALMREFARVGFIRWSDDPFTLKSGIRSHVYVCGREDFTDNPSVLVALARKTLDHADAFMKARGDTRRPGFIGIPVAGHPLSIVPATVEAIEHRTGRDVFFRVMREKKKEHGAHHSKWVAGVADPAAHCYILIDNVVTDGGSKREAVDRLAEDSYHAADMDCIVIVDREQGGIPKMRGMGFRSVSALYTLSDMTGAFVALGLWPQESAERVAEEIGAHHA